MAETLFTPRCGGVGGGYELMSSETKTTGSHSNIHKHTQMHNEKWHSPIRIVAFSAIGDYFSYRDPPCVQQDWEYHAVLDHSETLEHECAQNECNESLHLIREHAEVGKPLQCV